MEYMNWEGVLVFPFVVLYFVICQSWLNRPLLNRIQADLTCDSFISTTVTVFTHTLWGTVLQDCTAAAWLSVAYIKYPDWKS